jgi:peptide/nickel transport system permease protein
VRTSGLVGACDDRGAFRAQPFLRVAWWMSLFPGLALVVTVLGTNLLADGIQAMLDPRIARGGRRT